MARIPIIKLNNGSTSYYPLSVGESTVITHNIQVKGNIGGYQKDDIIPAVTTFDDILTTLFSGDYSEDIIIDNRTIIKDPDTDEICVNNEEVFKDIKCDEVIAEEGKIISAISQEQGVITATTRELTSGDIPDIEISQVNGLQDKIDELEEPLEVDDIPSGIPISKIQDLQTKLEEEIDASRIPTLEISKINGLQSALENPPLKQLSGWRIEGEAADCNRVIWDGDQWLWKNDAGVYVTFDSGEPATTDYNATKLVIGSIVLTRVSTDAKVLTEEAFMRKMTSENSKLWGDSYKNSLVGRIKTLEEGGGGGGGVDAETAEELDIQLHSVIASEIHNAISSMKFSPVDTVEIASSADLVNVVKNILIKLGVPKNAIAINYTAFGI